MPSAENRLIYTLGTSTRTPEEFIELLRSRNIEIVVDVRRFPTSRFEHFCQERMAKLLDEAGIQYVFLGDQLGGHRRGGYRAFIQTTEFHTGISKLEEISDSGRLAIICAERFPWRCHRRFIASELEKRGWQVSHIIDLKRDWPPRGHL